MLSNKIYKHFFIELSKYFFLVLFTFTAIVWAVQAVNYSDLIVDDGHAVSVYLGYSLLNISKILTKFIPLSFLLAVFLTILKFEDESEFMILWTAGLNKIRVVNFFLNVSFLVTVIQIVLASFVNPEVLNYSRSLIRSSNLDFISSMIKTNQFNDTVEGLTIYVEEKEHHFLEVHQLTSYKLTSFLRELKCFALYRTFVFLYHNFLSYFSIVYLFPTNFN